MINIFFFNFIVFDNNSRFTDIVTHSIKYFCIIIMKVFELQ
jgi:hypothetical protein